MFEQDSLQLRRAGLAPAPTEEEWSWIHGDSNRTSSPSMLRSWNKTLISYGVGLVDNNSGLVQTHTLPAQPRWTRLRTCEPEGLDTPNKRWTTACLQNALAGSACTGCSAPRCAVRKVSTRILGRCTAPFPPFLIPNRVPHGFTQDPSTDRRPSRAARRGAAQNLQHADRRQPDVRRPAARCRRAEALAQLHPAFWPLQRGPSPSAKPERERARPAVNTPSPLCPLYDAGKPTARLSNLLFHFCFGRRSGAPPVAL